ncbi:hypothetical protein LSPH24S_06975 [Lysinibacillus sphaericus]
MVPAYRTGCKLAVVDETGKMLEVTAIYPHPPKPDVAKSKAVVKEILAKYPITIIAIGNGQPRAKLSNLLPMF